MHSLAVFDTPDNSYEQKFNLMLGEKGELGVSECVNGLNGHLKLWSRELSGGTGARWVLSRVIYFQNLLPNDAVDSVYVLGFAEGANAIFVTTFAGVFMIEVQLDRVRKVCCHHGFCNLIPVVGFYTPLPRDERQNLPPSSPSEEAGGEDAGDLEKTFDQAQQLFDKRSNAIKEGDFVNAFECVSHDLKISPKILRCDVPGIALNVESVEGTTSKDTRNSTSSEASDSNVEVAPPSEKEYE